MKDQVPADNLLNQIRERPAMYLDKPLLLTSLRAFLLGYQLALSSYTQGRVSGSLLPDDFNEWVAYRLRFDSSGSGWRNMILERVPDETSAFPRLFELLDEHRNREPLVIAQVSGYSRKKPPRRLLSDGTLKEQTWSEVRPVTLKLIAYTDDPGFFVGSDEEAKFFWRDRFFSSLDWFEQELGVESENVTILEPERYARSVGQESGFNSQDRSG